MRDFAQSIVETVRHPLLILDDDLRIKHVNPAFYQTFKLTAAETLGNVIYELGEGQLWDIAELRLMFKRIVLNDSAFEEFEITHEFPSLGPRIMCFSARRVRHELDDTRVVLLAIEDVTEQRRAQSELERLNQELENRVRERTSQLAAANKELEAFCYSVSHDLRAPLRAMDGFSDELLRSHVSQLDPKGQHYLKRIRAGTQRMGQLIDDLLQLSRINRGGMTREAVDLTSMAKSVVSDLKQQESDRNVTFVVEPGLVANGNEPLLRVVLDNLLGNAWKFSQKTPLATIEFGKLPHESGIAYYVRDNGAGFDINHAQKMFGAFQRFHHERDFPGNGIGLATVQRVIHRHGGEIWAESAPNAGATFYFTIPSEETR